MSKKDIGVIGLGVMGLNLALNIERNGYTIAGYDLDEQKCKKAAEKFSGKQISVLKMLGDLLQELKIPKKILIMIPAGAPVDSVISDLEPHLQAGDIIIDGGNSNFMDTIRRTKNLEDKGLLFIGAGISGGEEGALKGPAIMPGGSIKAWPQVKPIFQSIAAKVSDGSPCCEWVGNNGAGHFVKMVHNGIEYCDMQIICESYFLMKKALGMTPEEMSKIFTDWNKSELNSYLIEITSDILSKKDSETGKPIVDIILDTAGQKGTGKWTSHSALDTGVPAQTIAEAVFARFMSAIKEERLEASKVLSGPEAKFEGEKKEFIEMIRRALYASKICAYAQGYQLMRMAAEEYGWDLNFGQIALMWRNGCIIRAQFLGKIKDAYDRDPNLSNLLLDPYFQSAIKDNQDSWRKVVSKAVELGLPIPAFSSALAYYDSYRSERLPANLLQAQRDYFGAHTYERVDSPRGQFFHTKWI